MEFQLIQDPVHDPRRCFICGDGDGPMVDLQVDEVDVTTSDGKFVVDARVYVCAPKPGRSEPRCAGQIARVCGSVAPYELEQLRARMGTQEIELRAALAEVGRLTEKLTGSRIEVVPLGDLLERYGERVPPAA